MDARLTHTPVMLHEAVDALVRDADGCYVDATFGRGGHSRALLARLGEQGRVIAFDKDPQAVAAAHAIDDHRFSIRHASFAALGDLPAHSADGILMDLGVSSPQIDDPQRGFSFRHDGPLDMRMDPTRGISVAQWLQEADIQHIAEVIRDYGEERFAQPVAAAIATRIRTHGPIARTGELAHIVAGAVKTREPGQHPATRSFQALRIFINAELEELQQALNAALRVLKAHAVLAVISFHSLEDRIVKRFMQQHARESFDRRAPLWLLQDAPAAMALYDVRRLRPSAQEVQDNPRARSAILRLASRSAAS